MHRLSIVINDIFNHYLPIATKTGISLNLDFADTTQTIDDPDCIKSELTRQLSNTLHKTKGSEITISVDSNSINIVDPESFLSKTACSLLSNTFVNVSSRVGFGTKITIPLKATTEIPSEKPGSDTDSKAKHPKTLIPTEPVTSSSTKPATKFKAKPQTKSAAKPKTHKRKRIRFEIS